MDSSDLQRIRHIRSYCEDVEKTIARFGADYEAFSTDTDYFNSISMSIMQVGELSVGLSDEFKRATGGQIQWGAIRGMRNMYAHAYAKMDKIAIWQTATIDIPGLLQFCERTIKKDREERSKKDTSVPEQLDEGKRAAAENSSHGTQKKSIDPER